MAKPQEQIKFLKTRNVKSPSRAFPTDAGIDFFVPKFDKKFIADLKEKNPNLFKTEESQVYFYPSASQTITFSGNSGSISYNLNDKNDGLFKFDSREGKAYFILFPHSRILIPSGIHSRMSSPGRALIAANKSGIASKYGLIFGAQVVDYTYKGEIHINVINTSMEHIRIYEDMKLIQFLETPIFNNIIEIEEADQSSNLTIENSLVNFYNGLIDDRGTGGFGSTDTEKEKSEKKQHLNS